MEQADYFFQHMSEAMRLTKDNKEAQECMLSAIATVIANSGTFGGDEQQGIARAAAYYGFNVEFEDGWKLRVTFGG